MNATERYVTATIAGIGGIALIGFVMMTANFPTRDEPNLADIEKATGRQVSSLMCSPGVLEKSRHCTYLIVGENKQSDGLFVCDEGEWTQLEGSWVGK